MSAVALRLEGLSDYAGVHALQERLVAARGEGTIPDVLLVVEHPETITLGRKRSAADGVLAAGDVPVVPIERGGEATWHGPGQLVAYPIVALEGERRDLHRHLHALEDAVIALLEQRGVASGTDPRNTGVWVGGRKICSIGIACRQWVTWHGLALNVDADLSGFARIRPCGFDSDVMTRLADELTPCPSLDDLVEPLVAALGESLDVDVRGVVRAGLDEGEDALLARIRATLSS